MCGKAGAGGWCSAFFSFCSRALGQEGCAHWTLRGHCSRVCSAADKVGPGVRGTDQKAEPRPALSPPGAAPRQRWGTGPQGRPELGPGSSSQEPGNHPLTYTQDQARRSRQTTPCPEEQTVTGCDVLSKNHFDPATQVPSAYFAAAGAPGPTCVPALPARNGPWRQRQWLLSRHR